MFQQLFQRSHGTSFAENVQQNTNTQCSARVRRLPYSQNGLPAPDFPILNLFLGILGSPVVGYAGPSAAEQNLTENSILERKGAARCMIAGGQE